ncbi:MAG: fused MFS/spermidine synthase [Acidobacteria bacterium]|nr:fused MFS/spermidine synthase [Acidobacteriota bacterium]
MAIYASTVFLSAFLLFLVQPLIAKLILPWFGGSAVVWNTCMLFFQILLLAGYAYAHWTIQKLSPKAQFRLHSILLALAVILTPALPPEWLKPGGESAPVLPILAVLMVTIGLPYFLLSSTSPLLQAWYSRVHNAAPPYRLFALSNLASLLALLAYPIAIEPYLPAGYQAYTWHAAFAAFGLFCAYTAWRASVALPGEVAQTEESGEIPAPPTKKDYLLWITLASLPTMLFLAFTSHLVQNVASIPFLWVVPLSMYLLSFILVFDSDKIYRPMIFRIATPIILGGLLYGIYLTDSDTKLHYQLAAAAFSLLVFCTFCHGELAARKPHPRYLTMFFLMMSVGGAIGGFLISIAAPMLLPGYFELYIALALFAFAALMMLYREHWSTDILWTAAAVATVVLAFIEIRVITNGSRLMVRNFYGSLRVQDSTSGTDKETWTRTLIHGTINHGLQFLSDERAQLPTTYYGPNSGVGLAIVNTWQMNHRVGLIGLGTGTLSSYARKGDYYRIYEINPLVLDVARADFRFLKGCRGTCDIVLGDARLSLERDPIQNFDVLAVDAFSGDSIPVHLLTKEAFQLYFRHLKGPNGVLAVHVSNKHLRLGPVVERIATSLGMKTLEITNEEIDEAQVFSSDWVLVYRPEAAIANNPLVTSAGEKVAAR